MESVLAVGVLAAAVGIVRDRSWGWVLGITVSVAFVLVWLAQEMVGLPGL